MPPTEYHRYRGTADTRKHGLPRIINALVRPEINAVESAFFGLLPQILDIHYKTIPPDYKEEKLYAELARQGGYAAFYKEGVTKDPVVFKVGGVATPEKDTKYQKYALAKLEALKNEVNVRVSGGTSALIDDHTMPNGAIRTQNGWIISFSGFQPHVDELFCIAVAKAAGIIDTQEAHVIASISGNKVFDEHFNAHNI